jgi:hypothetical protein
MRTSRIAVAVSGSALALASLAGCGSKNGTAQTPRTTRPTAPAPTTAQAHPLTQTELWDAVITEKDLPGFDVSYTQMKGLTYQPGIDPSRLPAVFPAACAPVYWSTQATGVYPATARIDAMADSDTPDEFGSFTLTVYSTADAPKVMADLHKALPACAGAHIERHDDLADGISFSRPEVQSTPHLGDDALSFRLTQDVAADDITPDPMHVPMTFTVVRVGATVVTFWNQGDATHTTPAVIAPELIPAQVTKLTQQT